LTNALIGLFHKAGVNLVWRQVEGEFPPPTPWFDVAPEGLRVWPDEDRGNEAVYDLREEEWIAPRHVSGLTRRRLPTRERARLVFSDVPVEWDRWVDAREQGADESRIPLVAPSRVLPE